MRDPFSFRRFVLATALIAAAAPVARAETRAMTLAQVIEMAQGASRSAAQARDRYRASLWQYRMYRASYLPTLSLVGTAPDLTRSISKLSLPDGSNAFIRQSYMSSGARLALGKTIGTTGGDVFVETALERLDLLDGNTLPTFLSTPVNIGLRQPLFAFNSHSWQSRIEPLRLTEARREYAEELESIAINAAHSFFDLLSANDQMKSALENVASTDTLLAATRARLAAKKTTEDEVLQTELASLNARLELQRAELEVRARTYSFRSYLGIRDTDDVRPQISLAVPNFNADVHVALTHARAHRATAVSLQRRRLEAQRDVAEARSHPGRSINLFASYGLSQSTENVRSIFHRGQEHQRASVGIMFPLLDWGREYARERMAESNAEVTLISVEQGRIDFEQEVTRKVLEFNVQSERMRIAATADDVAARRYAAAEQSYLSGKGDAMALNLALFEKDSARRAHIDALRGYWISYYDLRRATRYDFATGRVIEVPEPEE